MQIKTKAGKDLIHPTALIHDSAQIDDDVEIGPYTVIGENVTSIVLASAFLEKFGGDSLEEVKIGPEIKSEKKSQSFLARIR